MTSKLEPFAPDTTREQVEDTVSSEPARASRRTFTLAALGGVATLWIGCEGGSSGAGSDAGGDGDGPEQGGDGDAPGDGDAMSGDGDHGQGDGDAAGDGDAPGDGDAAGDGDSMGSDAGAGDGDSNPDAGQAGCSEGDPPPSNDADAQPISCTVRPEQTEGPYFVDERLRRYDIRADPERGCAVSEGTELRLKLGVYDVSGGSCKPLKGAVVDIWHCDGLGVYSDVTDTGGAFDTVGQKFLRGYQLSDAQGIARFVTVFPGWYTGRTTHIHIKVRTDPDSQQGFEWTSQLYFEDSVTDALTSSAPYASNTNQRMRNAMDGIFADDGGSQLVMQVRKEGNVLVGEFGMGLELA
jgi:protocatechuate 3,4-dioxygenase beta subunit